MWNWEGEGHNKNARKQDMRNATEGGCEHTSSLPRLPFGSRRGSHTCRLGRVVGRTAVAETVAHKFGYDVNVCSVPTVSQIIPTAWSE